MLLVAHYCVSAHVVCVLKIIFVLLVLTKLFTIQLAACEFSSQTVEIRDFSSSYSSLDREAIFLSVA